MGLSIGEVTQGYSRTGAEEYKNELNHRAITDTAAKLRDINDIKAAFQKGWQGQAEENFEMKLSTAVEETARGLEDLKALLDRQFTAIGDSMASFDNNIIDQL